MKRIVENKVYDPEKAELVESDSYSTPGDFHHTFQNLYITKKGTYFFHGGGGPLSEYAVSVGNNNTSGSENIWVPEEGVVITWLSKVNPGKALELFAEKFEEA